MSGTVVQTDLIDFASQLIEQAGGMVEWSSHEPEGLAIAPAELAACLGQTEETFPLTLRTDGPGLSLGLGGEFVDVASRALQQFVPAAGSFAMPHLPVKKSDFQRSVDQAFAWQNARARVKQGAVSLVAYHMWWFHAILRSEDAWESLLRVTVNCELGLPCPLGDVLDAIDLVPAHGTCHQPEASLDIAARWAEGEALRQAHPFLERVDQRLERDRNRLREYYRALGREAAAPNRRTKVAPSVEAIAAQQRAIKLELQRKLAELDERYAFDAALIPVALAEFQIPGLTIDVTIQRKAAFRTFRLIWNGLLKRLEPLRCSSCGGGSFNMWFTNEDVEPVCDACHRE
jgi:hypothetical protein